METPEDVSDTIVSYSMKPTVEYGNEYQPRGDYDLMEVVMIGVGEKSLDKKRLPGLLYGLLSNKLGADEKKRILETNYGFALNDDVSERMENMCNLSTAIEENAARTAEKETRIYDREVMIELLEETGLSRDDAEKKVDLKLQEKKLIL